jgi:hypothetical protein
MRKVIGTILLFAISCLCVEAGERLVQNGQTVAEVIQILGEPNGNVAMGNDLFLYYDGLTIKVTGGVVIDLSSNFNEALKSAQNKKQARESFVSEQKDKGLVLYKGEWLAKADAATRQEYDEAKERAMRRSAVEKRRRDIEVQKMKDQLGIGKTNKYGPIHRWIVNREDGSEVDHRPLAIPGKVALVLFHRQGAPICGITLGELKRFVKSDPCLELYQVDFDSDEDPISRNYGLDKRMNYLVRVVDPQGNLCSGPNTSVEMLEQYVAQAKKQCGL